MIKAIIFDIGGVIIRTEDHSSRRQWEKKLGLAEWESETIVFNSEMGQKAQSGAITDAELWTWVGQRLNLNGSELAAFRAGFWAGDVLDSGLVDFIRRLKETGYQTAVISNATDNLQNALTHQFKIADAFDLIVGSATEKVMKPDPRIYQRTLARLGRQPAEAVFIDDFAHNIQAAQELGMATIHFKPVTNVPTALATLGVMPIEYQEKSNVS
ncbi:MAG: HAD family phosphatase [Anaerolineae bacterium]|nr:HAD family phosphatase [Anaerolineae bacterium]